MISCPDVSTKSNIDLGSFTAIKHQIDTGDFPPIKQPARRTPLGFADEEEKYLSLCRMLG